jgi:hypothetical protein
MGRQDGAHQYASAAAPHSSFNKITGNIVREYRLNAVLQTGETLHSNHRLGFRRPVQAKLASALIGGARAPTDRRQRVDGLEQKAPPQRPFGGHLLVHSKSGQIAPKQVEVQSSDVGLGSDQRLFLSLIAAGASRGVIARLRPGSR